MTTTTRKIDDLGRVVLPSAAKTLGWSDKTPLDITTLDDGIIIIRAHTSICKLCGGVEQPLTSVGDALVCKDCLQIAANAVQMVGGEINDTEKAV